MSYSMTIVPSARKELYALPDLLIKRVDAVINRLADISRPPGCVKLKGVNAYRVRVGDYRIIYSVDDKSRHIKILAIGHRREIYR